MEGIFFIVCFRSVYMAHIFTTMYIYVRAHTINVFAWLESYSPCVCVCASVNLELDRFFFFFKYYTEVCVVVDTYCRELRKERGGNEKMRRRRSHNKQNIVLFLKQQQQRQQQLV